MGKHFAIVKKTTGGIEDGHLSYVSQDSDIDLYKIDDEHALVELTPEEFSELSLVDIATNRDGKETIITAEELTPQDNPRAVIKYRIDTDKLIRRIDDRPKIQIPIEIDGIGGKEIIGFHEKPESIIIERNATIIKVDSELEK